MRILPIHPGWTAIRTALPLALIILCFIRQDAYAQLYRMNTPDALVVLRASSGVAAPVIDEPSGNNLLSIDHRIGYSGVIGVDWFVTQVVGFYIEGVYARNLVEVEVLGAPPPGIDDIIYSSRAVHVGFTLQSGISPLLYASVGGGLGSLKASLDLDAPGESVTVSGAETGFSLAAAAGAKFMITDRTYLYGEMRWQRIWVGEDDASAYRLVPLQMGLGVVF